MAYYCFISRVWVNITPMEMIPTIEKDTVFNISYLSIRDEYNHFGMFFNQNNSYLYVLH